MTPTVPRGTLHLYLGIAPGAGKTYALLAEGPPAHGGGR